MPRRVHFTSDKKYENVTSRESSTEPSSVPDARQADAVTSSYGFQKRKKTGRKGGSPQGIVWLQRCGRAIKPTPQHFIKHITKDTENEAVLKMTQHYGFCIRDFRCISHPEAASSHSDHWYQLRNLRDHLMRTVAKRCGCSDVQDIKIWLFINLSCYLFFFPMYFLFVYMYHAFMNMNNNNININS